MTGLRVLGYAILVGVTLASAAPAGAVDILPHRAIYKMGLNAAESRSNVADVEGFMMFEWRDSCDGWSVTQKLAMTVYYATGESTDFGWSLNSWEAKDGMKYGFFVRRLQDGQEQQALRGSAELKGPGKSGVAHYTEPQPHDLELPAGTLFPTAHTLAVLKQAETGKPLFWSKVFDGSDEDGLFGVGAIIGKATAARAKAEKLPKELIGVPSWRLALAFYPNSSKELAPEHEQNMLLYRNGVAEDLILEYGDFSVRTTLTKLEALPPPGC